MSISYDKIAKRDLRELYDVSHTTFIRWLKRAGLSCFVWRKKFTAQEVILIFKSIGRPLIARTAAQRLVNIFHQIKGWLSDELRFRQKYQRSKPQLKQDQLERSEEEIDHPAIFTRPMHQSLEWKLLDALSRLRIIALKAMGRRAVQRQEEEQRQEQHQIQEVQRIEPIPACAKQRLLPDREIAYPSSLWGGGEQQLWSSLRRVGEFVGFW